MVTFSFGSAFAQSTNASSSSSSSTSASATLPNGVVNLAGADRMATANAIANQEYPKGATTAIIASGEQNNLVDALTAAPLAYALKAPILLSQTNNSLGNETLSELTSLGVKNVILIGVVGDSTNSKAIENELPTGVTATTISGATRLQTAAMIAQRLAKQEGVSSFNTVFVASGENSHLVDALAADPVAAAQGAPILLSLKSGDTKANQWDPTENAYLNGAATAYLIGEAGQYPFTNVPSSVNLVPIEGSTRAHTAKDVDEYFAPKGGYNTLFVSSGENAHLVDALTAGPLIAAADPGALALWYTGNTPPKGTQELLSSSDLSGVNNLFVIGGPASIPTSAYSSGSALINALPHLGPKLTITESASSVAVGSTDTLTLDAPSGSTVTWSVTSSNSSTGLISGTGDTATFVGTAPGAYTVAADYKGETVTATVTVFGTAAGVTVSPAATSLVADGKATDTVTATVVDSAGNTVQNFNGTVDINAVTGVDYWQNGTQLTPNASGEVSVTVTSGVATFSLGDVQVPGITVAVDPSDLASTNGQSVPTSPTYTSATVSTVPQQATTIDIVDAPKYIQANTVNTATMYAVVEDQAGYPMLSGTDSLNVTVTGAGKLTSTSSVAYDGFEASVGATNTSAPITVESEQGVTGPVSVMVSGSGLGTGTASISAVIAGAPAQIAATLSSGTFVEGSTGVTLTLQAEDANGVPVAATGLVTVTVDKNGSPVTNITVNGASPTTGDVSLINGSATITLTDNTVGADAGTYTVSVSNDSAFTFAAQSVTLTETAGSISKVGWNPSSQIQVPVTNPTATYTLQLTDNFGNSVAQSGVTVDVWAVGSSTTGATYGQATVNGTTATAAAPLKVTTNSSGQAAVKLDAEAFSGADWTLYAEIPAQTNVSVSSSAYATGGMLVSNQVPSSIGVSLEDTQAGSIDNTSTGDAVAGDMVTANLTLKDQYGIPISGNTTVQLTIPAGLSGLMPTGAMMVTGTWTPGSSNTVTVPVTLNASGQGMVGLEAWTEGAATLTASVPGLSNSVSGSATIDVQPGTESSVGLFSNGKAVSDSNELTVSANTPVPVQVAATDLAGNVVTATYTEVVDLSGAGGAFETTYGGAPTSTVVLNAGQANVTVYYVNATSGSYAPSATTAAQALTVTPGTITVAPTGTATVTAWVYSSSSASASTALSGQEVTFTLTSGSNGSLSTGSAVTNSSGMVTVTYTGPGGTTTPTGSIIVRVPGTTVATQTVPIK